MQPGPGSDHSWNTFSLSVSVWSENPMHRNAEICISGAQHAAPWHLEALAPGGHSTECKWWTTRGHKVLQGHPPGGGARRNGGPGRGLVPGCSALWLGRSPLGGQGRDAPEGLSKELTLRSGLKARRGKPSRREAGSSGHRTPLCGCRGFRLA